jgi:hypothetical protein
MRQSLAKRIAHSEIQVKAPLVISNWVIGLLGLLSLLSLLSLLNVCTPGRFKYFYLDLIVCGLDPRGHSATSIGVKPTSSFRKARILCVLSNPASCKSLSRVPIF